MPNVLEDFEYILLLFNVSGMGQCVFIISQYDSDRNLSSHEIHTEFLSALLEVDCCTETFVC